MGNLFLVAPPLAPTNAPHSGGTILAAPSFARLRSGHTLLEIAIALAIVGVLAAMGMSAFREQVARYRLFQTARQLHSDLLYLKAEAIASNREMRLLLVEADVAMAPGDDQAGAWYLQAGNRGTASSEWDTLPIDEDGTDDSRGVRDLGPTGNHRAGGISLAQWSPLAGPGSTGDNANAIVFSPRGFVANPPTDFVDGYIALELVNKYSLAAGGDEHVTIRLSRGGFARMEAGASSTLPANPVGTAEASSL